VFWLAVVGNLLADGESLSRPMFGGSKKMTAEQRRQRLDLAIKHFNAT
jgi:hypothetical protein